MTNALLVAKVAFAIVYGCGDRVACRIKIHFDWLVLIKKILINDEQKPINLKNLICFSVLIQSQHEGWTRSSTFRQVNTNRRGFPFFEKLLKPLSCLLCNFQHTFLLFRTLFPVGSRIRAFVRIRFRYQWFNQACLDYQYRLWLEPNALIFFLYQKNNIAVVINYNNFQSLHRCIFGC